MLRKDMRGVRPLYHPVFGLPGGVAKGISISDLPRFKEIAGEGLEFARFTLQVFKDIVLNNKDYVDLITSDTYSHKTYYMGLVDSNDKINFYDGMIRVVDTKGKEYAKFPADKNLDYIAEHVEPWSYVKFNYLKPLGWIGFNDGADTSIYSFAPLARLNVSDGMATAEAQKAYEEYSNILGGKHCSSYSCKPLGKGYRNALCCRKNNRACKRSGNNRKQHKVNTHFKTGNWYRSSLA